MTESQTQDTQTPEREKGLKALRYPVYALIDAPTRWMVNAGVSPNTITTAGFITTAAAGWLYHADHVRWAGLFILLGGLWDIFDGRVARVGGTATKFGSFYDSTLDRTSEIVMYLGMLSLYNRYGADVAGGGGLFGDQAMIYVLMLAATGSLMTSYTRSKAEALQLDCSVGFLQRAERLVIIGLGSIAFGLMWDGLALSVIIIGVAVLSWATTIQRILYVKGQAGDEALD